MPQNHRRSRAKYVLILDRHDVPPSRRADCVGRGTYRSGDKR
jgi:hypothetical protein